MPGGETAQQFQQIRNATLGRDAGFDAERELAGFLLSQHLVGKPAFQLPQRIGGQRYLFVAQAFEQRAGHGHQDIGVLQIVAVQQNIDVHLDGEKPPRPAEIVDIAAQFGGFAASDVAEEQHMPLRRSEHSAIVRR